MIWTLLLICTARLLLYDLDLKPEDFSSILHIGCLSYIEWRGFPYLFRGLICGSSDIGASSHSLFLETGLYHLIVVSGSHLVALEKTIDSIFHKNSYVKMSLLFLFAGMCKFNPPITRALLHTLLRKTSKHYSLFLRDDHLVLSSGLLTLIIFPQWVLSPSLQLSWIASLVMSLKVRPFFKILFCVLYISPYFGIFNWVSGINNLIFALIFDVIIFPLSILSLVVPWSSYLIGPIWDLVLRGLEFLPRTSTPLLNVDSQQTLFVWHYIFSLQLLHYWIRK
jgi:predicted membrane metal-binding protein